MKLKKIFIGFTSAYLLWVIYLLASPVETPTKIVSSCFDSGCAVFEGDWISFSGSTYKHEVFTDEIFIDEALAPQEVPYIEYEGKLINIGNFYYLVGAHMDSRMYVAVKHSDSLALLNLPWFLLYTISGYLPVYRHVQASP